MTGGAVGMSAQGGDALGGLVDHWQDLLQVVVEHLVSADEIGPDHVPVDVLQGHRQVHQCCETDIQIGNDFLGGCQLEARHRKPGLRRCRSLLGHVHSFITTTWCYPCWDASKPGCASGRHQPIHGLS